jgi:hypothetical protein
VSPLRLPFGLGARDVVVVAGSLQLALSVASLAIPKVLGWRRELACVGPMTRQVFWTYAAYVCGAHVAFGLGSVLLAGSLLSGSSLARAVAGFIAAWWGVRLLVALLGCERREMPKTVAVAWAHAALLALFTALTIVYGGVAAGLVS